MRYEHLALDISTAALEVLRGKLALVKHESGVPGAVCIELDNLHNEIRARLQRTDQDPKAFAGREQTENLNNGDLA
jgi:hypothetical protein